MVDIRDATTGASVWSWVGHDIDVNQVAFDATGASAGHRRRRRRAQGLGHRHGRADGHLHRRPRRRGLVPSFSPDGTLVAGEWLEQRPASCGCSIGSLASWCPSSSGNSSPRRTSPPTARDCCWHRPISPAWSSSILEPGRSSSISVGTMSAPPGPRSTARTVVGSRRATSTASSGSGMPRPVRSGSPSPATARGQLRRLERRLDPVGLHGHDGTDRVLEVTDEGARPLASVSARDTGNGLAAVAFSSDADRILTVTGRCPRRRSGMSPIVPVRSGSTRPDRCSGKRPTGSCPTVARSY